MTQIREDASIELLRSRSLLYIQCIYASLMLQTSQSNPATARVLWSTWNYAKREMLECAQPPPITTHTASTLIRGDHKQPSMPSTTSTTKSRATWAIGSLESHRDSVCWRGRGGEFSIKAVSCVLRSFYLAKLFGLSQIPFRSAPAPSTGPCSLLPACCPSRFRFRNLSFSQSVGRSQR